jgi:N-acyl-D-aspartate/D-glutamate deacylase
MRWLIAWFALLSGSLTAQDFDILIQNGKVVDGTGSPSFHGDLAIKGGRIAALGKLKNKTAARTIDANGLVVAPGFIDMHNHSDNAVLIDGDAQSMIRMGVTSMILGEGDSMAPTARFPRFTDYFSALLKSGVSTNIGSYLGSSTVFTAAHGNRQGPASAAEIDKMRDIVRQAMQDGALGISTSLHQPPGYWISINELVEMVKVAAEYGGAYATHIRDEGETVFQAVSEAIEIARRTGAPVDILHLKIAHQKLWGQMPELIGLIQNARNEGLDVQAHLYPYTVGQNAGLTNIIPPWAHDGGNEAMLARLKDPSLRARLEKEITNGIPGWYNHYTAVGSDWSRIQIAGVSNPAYQKYVGKRVSEMIADKKKPWLDVLFEALIDNHGAVPCLYYQQLEQDMNYAMKQPFVSFGSDGSAMNADTEKARSPHPRSYGTYARVLGRYVREQKLITLEEAVRKATSHNAAKVRLYDRGILRSGMWADVAVFNPNTIIDKATFENPHQYAAGIEYVFVNGKIVLDRGKHTGARPGAILNGPGKAPL